RAYRGPLPPTLGFLKPSKPEYHPCLIAAFGLDLEAVNSVHLIKLKADGSGKADIEHKTQAFWEFVDASRAPENAEMADLIEALGTKDGERLISPDAVYLSKLVNCAEEMTPFNKKRDGQPIPGTFAHWLIDRKNRKLIGRRLADC